MDRYLKQAGFYGVASMSFVQLDWALITPLVERWRPETHTFHMRHGEMSVTLEDVSVQLGLPVNGEALTGSTSLPWQELCHRLLEAVPATSDISFGRLKMKWLADNFDRLPLNAEDEVVRQYTRAFILQLIGGMVFADKSQSRVHLMYLQLLEDFEIAGVYSWGAACFAWLYRQLCRASNKDATQIAGPLILLQIWAWDRFPHISPGRRYLNFDEDMPLANRWCVDFDVTAIGTHVLAQYREAFDRQSEDQIVWRPYTKDILSRLPSICISGRAIWHARVPLICFYVVEWHYPDRVLKQFGGQQVVPTDKLGKKHKELHQIDLRGRNKNRWTNVHAEYILEWNSRSQRLVPLQRQSRFNYAHWYETHSRPTISHTGTMLKHLAVELQKIQVRAEKDDPDELLRIGNDIQSCRNLLADHASVRLHGRTDDGPDVGVPDSAAVQRFDGLIPSNCPVAANVASQASTSHSLPRKVHRRGPVLISQPPEERIQSQITQVESMHAASASTTRPRRTKCNANRGRLN